MHLSAMRFPSFILTLLATVLLSGFFLSLSPQAAYAAPPPVPEQEGTCTTDPQFNIPTPTPGQGMISGIITQIKGILNTVSRDTFVRISNDSGFRTTAAAVVSLYIAIYGLFFLFGMIQVAVYDFVVRMVKIAVIYALFQPNSWVLFSDTFVRFFNDGTDDIINFVTSIAVSGITHQFNPADPGSAPFAVLDGAISRAISAKMAVTLLAMAFTGPYGLMFFLLLTASLGSFLKSLLMAVWVYIMSLVIKTLLFGLAPIFLCCLLFSRTRPLFDGWLNQIINASLQPIFLFIFFAFFVTLISSSIDVILATPVCWTETSESLKGTPYNLHYWRFTIEKPPGSRHFEPYGGLWTWTGADNPGSPQFPIDIIAILIFLMLAELAGRFNSIVIMIASELAGASTNLSSMQGAMNDWFSSAQKGGKTPSLPGTRPNRGAAASKAAAAGVGVRPGGAGGGSGNRGSSSAAAESLKNISESQSDKGTTEGLMDQYRDMSNRRNNVPED